MVLPGLSTSVASRLVGRTLEGERPITVDQTNESIIVAEQFVVKWMQPPVPSPHPGAEVLMYLSQHGFTDMPAFIGVHEVDDMVVAIVTEYVPDSLDGWDWYVDDVDAWLRGELQIDALVAAGRLMGQMTSDLHSALAGVQRSSIATRTYHAHAVANLHEAMRTVSGEEGDRLRSCESAVYEALEPLRGERMLQAHRVHGDLHAGQFIRSRSRLLMIDFDGNPLSDPTERRLPQSPLRDLASMLQSIDHVGRIVVKRRHPDRGVDVDLFTRSAIDAALGAYTASHAVDHDVLRALRVAQELHEYCYAAAHLPHWVYVPDAALPPLLEG